MTIDFTRGALLIIDAQKDFCPGGALAVDRGDEVVEPLNALARLFAAGGGRVVATQDWHPRGHVSFASAHPGARPGDILPGAAPGGGQALWPDHCVQGSPGAALHEGLDRAPVQLVLRKGWRRGLDSYSAFFENDRVTPTGLEGYLREAGVETVVLGGLATDYCVLYSALDAARRGFRTLVVRDAVRGVGYPAGSVEAAFRAMEEAGIALVTLADLRGGAA